METLEIQDLITGVIYFKKKTISLNINITLFSKEIHSNKLSENSLLLLNDGNNINALDEKDIDHFCLQDYENRRCSKQRTLFHLVCESGLFKYVRNCFNKITLEDFKTLSQIEDENNKTLTKLAEDKKFQNNYKKLRVSICNT